MKIQIKTGDCIDVLKSLEADSIDAIVTDPPYGLNFMGKEWDAPWKSLSVNVPAPTPRIREAMLYQHWCELWLTECFRVLKPGGTIKAFTAPRMLHRLKKAIRNVGFTSPSDGLALEAWIYSSGMPKSYNVGKAMRKAGIDPGEWEGYGTSLKPAYEPIVVGQKPPRSSLEGVPNDTAEP